MGTSSRSWGRATWGALRPRLRELRFTSGLQDERFGETPLSWRDAPHIAVRLVVTFGIALTAVLAYALAGMAVVDMRYALYGALLTAIVLMGLRSNWLGVAPQLMRVAIAASFLGILGFFHLLAIRPLLDEPTGGWAALYHATLMLGQFVGLSVAASHFRALHQPALFHLLRALVPQLLISAAAVYPLIHLGLPVLASH